MVSRGLSWLATPSRDTKRDSYTSFGPDVEDVESPAKRPRQISPKKHQGDYEPLNVEGRAVTGFMIPPLPPHLSLEPKSDRQKGTMNFSRPTGMINSKSMPYLDPPNDAMSTPGRRRGVVNKSSQLNLGETGSGKEVWSPWKDQRAPSSVGRTPSRRTPALSETREVSSI
jgi:nucleoporin NUP1